MLSVKYLFAAAAFAVVMAHAAAVFPDPPTVVQVVHRHGDRAPIQIAPNYKDNNAWVSIGAGELSDIGMAQLRSFGRLLRQMYITSQGDAPLINPNRWVPGQYNARSSDVHRTLQSGLELMSTLVPGQPVPMHTVPQDWDNLLQAADHCASYVSEGDYVNAQLAATWNTPEYAAVINASLIWSGWTMDFVNQIGLGPYISVVDDNLNCVIAHNLYSNPVLTPAMQQTLHDMHRAYNYAHFSTKSSPDPRGALGSAIGNEFIQNIENAQSQALYHYSAHDDTVSCVYTALGVFTSEVVPSQGDALLPPYASSVVVEYYDGYAPNGYVKVYWGMPSVNASAPDGWTYNLHPLALNCTFGRADGSCLFTDFKALIASTSARDSDVHPDSSHGCCVHTANGWDNLGCDDYASYTDQMPVGCQLYRQWCPDTSCGGGETLGYGTPENQKCMTPAPTAELCWRWLLLGIGLTSGIAIGVYYACRTPAKSSASAAAAAGGGGGSHQSVTSSAGGQASDSLLAVDHKSDHH